MVSKLSPMSSQTIEGKEAKNDKTQSKYIKSI